MKSNIIIRLITLYQNVQGIRTPLGIVCLLLVVLFDVRYSTAQIFPRHAEIKIVDEANLTMELELNGNYRVITGTKGQVIEKRDQSDEGGVIAQITVMTVYGRTVVCSIDENTETPATSMFVTFNEVQSISEMGVLEIRSDPPGATVVVGTEEWGPAPQSRSLPSRMYTVRVNAPGYESSEPFQYRVTAPERTVQLVTLKRILQTGNIIIRSNPTQARVFIDGEDLGLTYLNLPGRAAGEHTLLLQLDGYETLETSFIVPANDTFSEIFELLPVARDTTTIMMTINEKGLLDIKARLFRSAYASSRDTSASSAGKNEMILVVQSMQGDHVVSQEPITLISGEAVEMSMNVFPDLTLGRLIIAPDPQQALFSVTGPDGYAYEGTGEIQLEVQEGEYRVFFQNDNYEDHEVTENVFARGTTNVKPKLTLLNYTGPAGIEFVRIDAGEFELGSNNEQKELPIRSVILSTDFFISRNEISQGQYQEIVGKNPSENNLSPALPVARVSWYDAADFANELSRRDGLEKCYPANYEPADPYSCEGYRLPTEAEWEYTAKRLFGPQDVTRGILDSELTQYGWFKSNSKEATNVIGSRASPSLGINDILGNVSEWTNDWESSDYSSIKGKDPIGTRTGTKKIMRGGSFRSVPSLGLITRRYVYEAATNGVAEIGFRLVRSAH